MPWGRPAVSHWKPWERRFVAAAAPTSFRPLGRPRTSMTGRRVPASIPGYPGDEMKVASLALGVVGVLALLAPAVPESAQPSRPTVDAVFTALNRVVPLRETAISPDGASVAWVERVRTPDGGDS